MKKALYPYGEWHRFVDVCAPEKVGDSPAFVLVDQPEEFWADYFQTYEKLEALQERLYGMIMDDREHRMQEAE